MATHALISIPEYLATSYHPDREYLDGVVVERKLGEKDHSKLQRRLISYLDARSQSWGIQVFPEQRVQVKPARFRVPDIVVVAGPEPDEQIFTSPPLLCIEILSKDDRMSDLQEKIHDYLEFGVRYVWVIDPRTRRAWDCTRSGMRETQELRASAPDICVPLSDLFD